MTLLFNYQNRGQFADDLYMDDLYSPALRVSSNKSVEQFVSGARQLKPGVDAERSKELRAAGEEDSDD